MFISNTIKHIIEQENLSLKEITEEIFLEYFEY